MEYVDFTHCLGLTSGIPSLLQHTISIKRRLLSQNPYAVHHYSKSSPPRSATASTCSSASRPAATTDDEPTADAGLAPLQVNA